MRTSIPRAGSGGLIAAVASAICFGVSGPFAKPLITAGFSPLHVVWLRVFGAAVLMLPLAVRHAGALRRAPGLLLAYGLIAVCGVQACYFAAIASVPVAVALLLEFLGPVLVLGWLRFVRRRPVSRRAVAGTVLALVGLAGVVEIWAGLRFEPLGLLLALGAAGCQAGYFLLSDSSAEVEPPALAAYGLLVGAVVLTGIARPWEGDWARLSGSAPLALLGGLIVLSTVLAYLTGIVAVRRLSPPVAGAVAFLEPVVATALAWLLLAEELGPWQLGGGALVLAGAYVAQRAAPAGGSTAAPVRDEDAATR